MVKKSNIEFIKGRGEIDPKACLAQTLDELGDNLEHVVIVTKEIDGNYQYFSSTMNQEFLAYSSVLIQQTVHQLDMFDK